MVDLLQINVLCGGYGFLVVIEQAVSFQGGHFLKTNNHESGHYKGAYNVYLHNGHIYIIR